MKRLQIILGSAALLLAVSGAIVTKANTTLQTRYIQNANSCQAVQSSDLCVPGGDGCELLGQQLFADQDPADNTNCITELKEP